MYPKKDLDAWELAKEASRAPIPSEARMILGISAEQFAELIGISPAKYWRWIAGESQPSIAEKILIVRCLDIARKKGFIQGPVKSRFYGDDD